MRLKYAKLSGKWPKVVALFSATNFYSFENFNIIWLFKLHDKI